MKKFLILFIIAFFSTSCSLIFNGRKTTVVSSTDSTVKTAYMSSWIEKPDGAKSKKIVGPDNKSFRVKSRWYIPVMITEEKDGYLTQTVVIKPNKFNFFKLINLAATLPIFIANIDSPVFYMSMFYSIFYGWWEILIAPNTIPNQKEIVLPPMEPVPSRTEKQNFIALDSLYFSYEVAKTQIKYFSKPRRLINDNRKGKKKTTVNYNGTQKEFEYYISEALNNTLKDFGYADTSKSLFRPTSFNTYQLRVEIKKMSISKCLSFGGIADMTVRFTLKTTMEDKELISSEISASSILMSAKVTDLNDKIIINALENCFVEFIKSEEVQKIMVSNDEVFKEKTSNWDQMDIKVNGEYCTTHKEAIDAVVTVINGKSHGSGCIISNDGYIITNYHVVAQNKDGLMILAGDSDKVKCELIRFNEKMDLALLKSSPMNTKPLQLKPGKEILIGIDVFAIGTPADIELGQSISKGIISGKRKINEILMIQTDVSVNPGNSGGALVGTDGVLLGIVSSKVFGPGLEGIGFVIPAYYIEEALKINIIK